MVPVCTLQGSSAPVGMSFGAASHYRLLFMALECRRYAHVVSTRIEGSRDVVTRETPTRELSLT